jgi:hypothetical protein
MIGNLLILHQQCFIIRVLHFNRVLRFLHNYNRGYLGGERKRDFSLKICSSW